MKTICLTACVFVWFAATTGCVEHRVKTDPIKVEPIHITVDVNLKIDRQLDEFFDFEDDVAPPAPSKKPSDIKDPTKG